MNSDETINGGMDPTNPPPAPDTREDTQPGTPQDELSRVQAQANEYLDLLQRERANFINFRRRAEQERLETQQYATLQLIKKLLPIVDDFDRALAAAPDAKANPWVAGVALIDRKLHNVLEAEGISPIDSLHQPFDPNVHEAVEYEDGEGDDIVVDELNRGYRMRDRVIRPAMVRVGKQKREA
jgi:molecular chaperone GrpE